MAYHTGRSVWSRSADFQRPISRERAEFAVPSRTMEAFLHPCTLIVVTEPSKPVADVSSYDMISRPFSWTNLALVRSSVSLFSPSCHWMLVREINTLFFKAYSFNSCVRRFRSLVQGACLSGKTATFLSAP